MSTAVPYSPASSTVVRSHSSSSRFPRHHQSGASDLPQRTRSAATRPSAYDRYHHQYHHQGYHPSHSRSHSHDPRPTSIHSPPDYVVRGGDYDTHRTSSRPSSSSRRESPKEQSRERSSNRKHYPTPSTNGYKRDPADNMAATATATPSVVPPAPGMNEEATTSAPTGYLHTPLPAQPPKRRTTVTTPSGQWALGKTIGAGSMGKVKLAKNMETGEQVSNNLLSRRRQCYPNFSLLFRRLSKSYRDKLLKNTAARPTGKIVPKKFEPLAKLPLSAS